LAIRTDSRAGTELAGYRLEAIIGRGGMSVVYRAEHLRLRRKAAVKLLAPELAEDDRFRERFLGESQLAASLDHPNIVPVYDAGEVDGLLYLAMRYVEGIDLRALLRRDGALSPERALGLVSQVAQALDAAHEYGLVHRDVKPSNVLVEGHVGSEHCYLADFGLSKIASDRSDTRDWGQTLGTVDYVAPEQIEGGLVDGRTDEYSLACLLYECLIGEVPFKRASDVAVIYAHLEDAPPVASELRSGLPVELDAVLSKGMAKRADDRWQTCGTFTEAARASIGQGVEPSRSAISPDRTHRKLLALGAAAGVLAAAALAGLHLFGGGTPVARADSVVRIDPVHDKVTAGARLGSHASSVTVCAANVWVAAGPGKVAVLDPRTLVAHVVRIHGLPRDIADIGNLLAVVVGPPANTATVLDAQFAGTTAVIRLPGEGDSPAVAAALGGTFWIANPNAHELDRIDTPYTGIGESIPLPRASSAKAVRAEYAAVAAGEGALWVAGGSRDRMLWRVDPTTRRVVASIRLPFAPRDVAAGDGGVWVVDSRRSVVRIDPATNRISAKIRVGHGPVAVAVGANSVWVVNEADGTVSRIDPRRNAVSRTMSVGSRPIDVAVGLGSVWVVRRPE
jgi:YVTN family beta-propeller protein